MSDYVRFTGGGPFDGQTRLVEREHGFDPFQRGMPKLPTSVICEVPQEGYVEYHTYTLFDSFNPDDRFYILTESEACPDATQPPSMYSDW